MPEKTENKTVANNRDDNDQDSGFSEGEARIILKKKRTEAQLCYRRANAAVIPDFIPLEERTDTDCVLRETQVFTPDHGLSKDEIERFIYLAAKRNFSMEQALALLHCNKYDINASRADMKTFFPLPSQWRYDKSTFIHALKEEEKYFDTIKHKFFPNRKVIDLVEYYYTWKMEKKKRNRFWKIKKNLIKTDDLQQNNATSA